MIKFVLIPAEFEIDYISNTYSIDIGYINVGTPTFNFTGSLFYFSFFEVLVIYEDKEETERISVISFDFLYLWNPLKSLWNHFKGVKQ
jgi:hypothetical protein